MPIKTNTVQPLREELAPHQIRVVYVVKCRIQKLRGGFVSREIHSHAVFSNAGPNLNIPVAQQQLEVHLYNKYKARRVRFTEFKITEVTPL